MLVGEGALDETGECLTTDCFLVTWRQEDTVFVVVDIVDDDVLVSGGRGKSYHLWFWFEVEFFGPVRKFFIGFSWGN